MKNKTDKKVDTKNTNVWALIKMRQNDFNTEFKYKLQELQATHDKLKAYLSMPRLTTVASLRTVEYSLIESRAAVVALKKIEQELLTLFPYLTRHPSQTALLLIDYYVTEFETLNIEMLRTIFKHIEENLPVER